MEYIIKGKLTLKDYTEFNKAALFHKKSYFIVLLICLFSIFFGAISSIIKNPTLENIIAQLLPILIIFVIYFFLFSIFKTYSFKSDKTLNDETTLTLSESGINYATHRGSFNYTTDDFRKVIITNKIIAIYVSFRKAILIPRHFFTSKEQEQEIVSFIKEKYSPKKNANRG